MFVFTNNIFLILAQLLASAVELYLLVALARLGVGQVPAARKSTLFQALTKIADPVPQRVGHTITQWRGRQCPVWISWTVVIVLALIARQGLWLIIVSMINVRI